VSSCKREKIWGKRVFSLSELRHRRSHIVRALYDGFVRDTNTGISVVMSDGNEGGDGLSFAYPGLDFSSSGE
jgi:hypothetical protein